SRGEGHGQEPGEGWAGEGGQTSHPHSRHGRHARRPRQHIHLVTAADELPEQAGRGGLHAAVKAPGPADEADPHGDVTRLTSGNRAARPAGKLYRSTHRARALVPSASASTG